MGNCSSTSKCNPCGPDFSAINQLATKAGAYARQANTYAVNAENSWLEFNALYLGAFAVAPTVDNEGNPLQVGALYWNSVTDQLFVWEGSSWILATGFNEFTPFISTGSNTARNLVSRTADIVNVRDFGAIGNGSADDTTAIRAALVYAGTTKTILIPNGNFVVTGDCIANTPVIFDGFLTISSPTVKFELKSQPIVFTDYRKIYMGSNWNVSAADCSVALKRAVDELLVSFKYYTLDCEGWRMLLQSEIEVIPPTSGYYGQYKTIKNAQVGLLSGFGNRNTTTGVVTANPNAFAFNVSGTPPTSVYGIIFENIHIYCERNGNGIKFNFPKNQESEINGCNITNFYLKAISASNPIRINGCHISGGDFNLYDSARTITGIEILSGDSEIISSTISYCKYGILCMGETLLVSNSHIFNDSTDNDAPTIYVKSNQADMKVVGCYIDSGPIVIERVSGYDTFGRVGISDSVFTWGSKSRGNRSFVIARPLGSSIEIRGIYVSGCQFRDYRIFERDSNYTGDGTTTTFQCPLVKTTASYTESNCETTTGSNQIKVASTYKYQPGLKVVGSGIPANTIIDSIVDTETLQLNNNATATSTTASLTFSETLEVKVNGTKVFNWTISAESGDPLQPTQTVTFSSPPAAGATIDLNARYFAVVPFDYDSSLGTLDVNDAWDISIVNNSYYDRVTNDPNDDEPVMRQSSSPILKIETNNIDTDYAVDWGWKTPFRLHVLQIESIGWRCDSTIYTPPPVIGYDYDDARRGKLILSTPEDGFAMIKGFVAGDNNINPVV